MWGSTISNNTLRQLVEALQNPRFVLGQSNFSIKDLTAYVTSTILAHNSQMMDLLSKYCMFSNQRDWATWTGTEAASFTVRTEQTRPAVQRNSSALQITGAPLQARETAFDVSEEGLRVMTGVEFARQIDMVKDGDKVRLIKELLYRLLTPTEESTFDHRSDGRAITVRGLANGDAWIYPRGLYGAAISGAHSHYMFQTTATLTDLDLDRGLKTVREHGIKTIKIICSPLNEGEFNETNIPGFKPALYIGIDPGISTDHVSSSERRRMQEDLSSEEEIYVGRYKGVPVYSLWYWPVDYISFEAVAKSDDLKPLVCRTFTGGYMLDSMAAEIGNVKSGGVSRPGFGDLRVMHDKSGSFKDLFDISHFEREVGFGARNRVSMAIMSLNPGAYVVPDIETLVVAI